MLGRIYLEIPLHILQFTEWLIESTVFLEPHFSTMSVYRKNGVLEFSAPSRGTNVDKIELSIAHTKVFVVCLPRIEHFAGHLHMDKRDTIWKPWNVWINRYGHVCMSRRFIVRLQTNQIEPPELMRNESWETFYRWMLLPCRFHGTLTNDHAAKAFCFQN